MTAAGVIAPDFGVISAIAVCCVVGAVLIGSLASWARTYAPDADRPDPKDPQVRRTRLRRIMARQVATAAFVAAVVALAPGISAGDVGWQGPSGRSVGLSVAVTAYILVLATVGGWRARRAPRPGRRSKADRFRRPIIAEPGERAFVCGIAIMVGIAEESLFRGLFVATCVGLLSLSPGAAVIVVAALFGVAHAYQGVRGVLATTLVGALLGTLYLQTHSLLMPVIVHSALDIVAFVVVPRRPTGPRHA